MCKDFKHLDYYAIGIQLRTVREQLHLSQEAVADLMNITPSTVYRFETGQRKPSLEMLHKFASIANIPIDQLLNPNLTEPEFIYAYNRLNPQKKKVVNETIDVLISSLSSNL